MNNFFSQQTIKDIPTSILGTIRNLTSTMCGTTDEKNASSSSKTTSTSTDKVDEDNNNNNNNNSESTAILLTEENIIQYIKDHNEQIGVFSPSAELQARAITGGNVNFAFCIIEEETNKSIFIKQAPEYVAIFGPNGLPLTSNRMEKEYNVYKEWEIILGDELTKKYLPKLYYFDDKNMVFVMEFFDGYTLLDHDLVEIGILPTSIVKGLGEFMALTHAATHKSKLDSEKVLEYTTEYENRAMRDIQLQYVFTKCYAEATDEQRAGLNVNDDFLKEVELLKKEYNGNTENLVLCHGDLHPGSVMVNKVGDVKVIDPEFTIYGPPGLDVGSLLSGYVLAAVHQSYSNKPEAVKALQEASKDVWETYKAIMLEHHFSEDVLKRIEIETIGYTVAEVCRTALGFAGGRLWLQFDDLEVKGKAVKSAMKIVETCMIGRHEGGMDLLLEQMMALSE